MTSERMLRWMVDGMLARKEKLIIVKGAANSIHFSKWPQGAAQDKTNGYLTHPQRDIHIDHRLIVHTLQPPGGKYYTFDFSQCWSWTWFKWTALM